MVDDLGRRDIQWRCHTHKLFKINLKNLLLTSYARAHHHQSFKINMIALRFLSILQKCTHLNHLKQTHAMIFTHGFQHHTQLSSKLATFYISFNCFDIAHLVFAQISNPSTFLWNMMIRASATQGRFQHSLKFYTQMIHTGLTPDKFTFPFALKSCACLSDMCTGEKVHQHLICCGCSDDVFIAAALVDMYAKCGHVQPARTVFDKISVRDLVLWNSMITGYVQNGCNGETLEFFEFMQHSQVKPNRVALLSVLLASGNLGAMRMGERFHSFAIKTGLFLDILVVTEIMDMYTKCGSLDYAKCLFDQTVGKDVVCWSAMIASYGTHGHGRRAIHLFHQMIEAGVRPNHVTFTCLLSACSHSGLLQEGQMYFRLMSNEYGIEPTLKHYSCMVDLLGRAGKLSEAELLVESMPVESDSSIWGSLLNACRIHGNLDLGERVGDKIFQLDPTHAGYRVLLSNVYASKSRWSEVVRVRKEMDGRGSNKIQGHSVIEIQESSSQVGSRE